jgi:hypothetical protein
MQGFLVIFDLAQIFNLIRISLENWLVNLSKDVIACDAEKLSAFLVERPEISVNGRSPLCLNTPSTSKVLISQNQNDLLIHLVIVLTS